MADFETKVRVTAKTQGFDKVASEAAKLAAAQQNTAKGLAASTKAATAFQGSIEKALKAFDTKKAGGQVENLNDLLKELGDQLDSTAERQLELQKSMLGTEKGSEAYKKFADEVKNVDDEAKQLQKTLGLVERAFRGQAKAAKDAADSAKAASGAFRQGFAQGSGMGEFVQRGPGMGRQMVGRALGRAAVGIPRGVAGGLASTPFSGSQGLAQGLSSLPGGGLLAGPMQAALGYGGQALSYQRQMVDLAPSLFGGAASRSIGAARARGVASGPDAGAEAVRAGTARLLAMDKPIDTSKVTMDQTTPLAGRNVTGGFMGKVAETMFGPPMQSYGLKPEAESGIRAQMMDEAEAGERAAIRRERESAGSRAASIARRKLTDPISKAGFELAGLGKPEAMQFAGQVAQAGGGDAASLQSSGLLRAGFAAKTAFGVGPEVTGDLLSASRRGGVVGGAGGDQMAKMIADGMALGLTETEIPEYMQQMSEGIENWRQTGIPLNPDTIREMGGAFSGMGLGVVQGQRVGKGIQSRAQGIATSGPGSATDMLLMQSLGGFKGGGIEDFQAARKKMEQGDFGEAEIQDFLKNLTTATGGGAAGEAALQASMNQMGITMGPTQAGQLLAAGRGGPMSKEQQEAISQFQTEAKLGAAKGPKSVKDMEGAATRILEQWGPNLKQQASIQDQQLATGQKLATAMLSFEGATAKTASAFGVLAPQITDIAKGAEKLAALIPKAAQWLEDKIGQKDKGILGAMGLR